MQDYLKTTIKIDKNKQFDRIVFMLKIQKPKVI